MIQKFAHQADHKCAIFFVFFTLAVLFAVAIFRIDEDPGLVWVVLFFCAYLLASLHFAICQVCEELLKLRASLKDIVLPKR